MYRKKAQSWNVAFAVRPNAMTTKDKIQFDTGRFGEPAQAFAKALPAAAFGIIINIIDQRVWKLNPRFFSYTLSKSGLWTATRTLAQALAPRIRNAGAVFVGSSSPVASGDYATGGNHVLPTGGWARSVGGLGLETFLKPVTVQRLTPAGLELVRPTVEALAACEGMSAHAAAVQR